MISPLFSIDASSRFNHPSFFLSFQVCAQITVSSERDKDGNILIHANNTEIIPYSVLLNFSTLVNLSSSGGRIVTGVARPGTTTILKLRPTIEGQSTDYRFTYSYGKGDILGKNREEPIYLVPVTEGQTVEAVQMTHIENKLGSDRQNDEYVGVSFSFETPTLIVAPRKGIISEVNMDVELEKDNLNYSRTENHIEIYHDDGSFTKLTVLKSGSERVSVGDLVFPGDVLAESGGENYVSGNHVRMVTMKTV